MSMKGWLWTLSLAVVLPKVVRGHSPITSDRVGDACPFAVCYRKLEPGKKALEIHIGRTFKCDNVDDCRRACDYEKTFVCEGFNYRRAAERGFGGRCELTATPYPRMDRRSDFVIDEQCDYYEKRRNCFDNDNVPRVQGPRWYYDRTTAGGDRYATVNGKSGAARNGRPIFSAYPSYRNAEAVVGEPPMEHRDRGTYYESSNRLPYPENYPSRAPLPGSFLYPKSLERRTDQLVHRGADPWKDLDGRGDIRGTVHDRSYPYPTDHGAAGPAIDAADTRGGPPLSPDRSWQEPSRPRENDHFYGKFYNYGDAFGYGRKNVLASKGVVYGETASPGKCSLRATAGSRLARGLLRKTCLARDLDQCEMFCVTEQTFRCSSFTYRYNVLPTDPTDNCLLSDVSYQDLNFYTDLEPDRNYDVYSVSDDPRICSTRKPPDRSPSDDCFWRVRSGFGLPSDVTKKSMVASDLGECQLACTMSRDFTCRSLAIAYDGNRDAPDSKANCFLSDWPSGEISPAEMPDKHGAELYERGSFSRGCEPYPFPALPLYPPGGKPADSGPLSDEACYSGYHRPCKLTPHAVFSSMRVNAEPECRRECSRMRERGSVPCMSFSYRSTAHDTRDNCQLSDVSTRDLRPDLDYTYDDDHVLYAWRELDPYCQTGRYSVRTDDAAFRPIRYDDEIAVPFRPNPPAGASHAPRPIGLFDAEAGSFPIRDYGPLSEHDTDTTSAGYDRGGLGLSYPREISVFRMYTVNGHPCRNGTYCQRNEIAGFWSCEIGQAEYDSWDYCCEPTHHCGFSQGYHYPWCYVGPSEDQWRPCSETYYPYLLNGDRSDRQPNPEPNGDVRSHDSSRCGYAARHWPIIYLHKDAPPNCTDRELLADGGREFRGSSAPRTFHRCQTK